MTRKLSGNQSGPRQLEFPPGPRSAPRRDRRRLAGPAHLLVTVGPDGRRPYFGWVDKLQHDPAWKDNLLFNEYFHGDNGAGLGARH